MQALADSGNAGLICNVYCTLWWAEPQPLMATIVAPANISLTRLCAAVFLCTR